MIEVLITYLINVILFMMIHRVVFLSQGARTYPNITWSEIGYMIGSAIVLGALISH